jgi:8-oxo-dGTP diphosphatase
MVTVDLVVFTLVDQSLRVLMVRRRHDPFAGKWAIPGGYLEMDEPVEAAARRELREETGLEVPGTIEPIGFFGRPGRDPRGRTITLAHAAVLRSGAHPVQGGDDAWKAEWMRLRDCTDLAFDHTEILAAARQWLSKGLLEGTLGLELLPHAFNREVVYELFKESGISRPDVEPWLEKMLGSGAVLIQANDSKTLHLAVLAT